jgi:uncharacterized protein YbaP (TraB family)
MLRLLLQTTVYLVGALLAPEAFAQAGGASDALLKQAEKAPKRGFFWEARKGNNRVYLLGTVHVGRAEFFPPNIEYLRRFNESSAIVLEANVFDAKRVGEVVQKLALYPDGEPGLDTRISAETKTRVTAQAKRFGLEPERVWRMKPWMVANTLPVCERFRQAVARDRIDRDATLPVRSQRPGDADFSPRTGVART